MRHSLHWLLLWLPFLLGSCVELIEMEGDMENPLQVSLPFHEFDLMVGDSVTLVPVLKPDTAGVNYYWFTRDEDSQRLRAIGRHLKALEEGDVTLFVKAMTPDEMADDVITPTSVVDSCVVHIFQWEPMPEGHYPYDMVLYCTLSIDGVDITNELLLGQTELVALVDGEVRGKAEVLDATVGGQVINFLCLRISSPEPAGEEVTLQCYMHGTIHRIILDQKLTFDGESHGTLSNLVKLTGKYQ